MKRLTCGHQFVLITTIEPEREERRVRAFSPKGPDGRELSSAPFCRFGFPPHLSLAGVYAVTVNDRVVYVGKTNNLSRRWGPGEYGDIVVPKPGGNHQVTNRRVNHAILEAGQRGDVVQVWFHDTAEGDVIEGELIGKLDLSWNREGPEVEERAVPSPRFRPDRITGSRLQMRDLVIRRVGRAVGGKNPHVVCEVDGIGRVAFWGRTNIDLLRARAGLEPFIVRCGCRGANIPYHDAWVPQDQRLRFIEQTSMQFPAPLTPTTVERISLSSGRTAQIAKANPQFELWSGKAVADTFGNKPILSFDGKPAFAELVILGILQSDGWSGVWVDTFHNKYRTSYWPKNEAELPPKPQQLLQRIYEKAGSKNGCWDVFCWKEEMYLFAESKRQGHDRITDTQRVWLEAAIECQLPLSSFLIVEWSTKPNMATRA